MSFWALPGWQVLPGLTRYLYLDRFGVVVRGRGFSGEASSVLAVLCARPLMGGTATTSHGKSGQVGHAVPDLDPPGRLRIGSKSAGRTSSQQAAPTGISTG